MCVSGVWQEKAFENNLPWLKTDPAQALMPAQPQPQPHACRTEGLPVHGALGGMREIGTLG